MKSMKIQGSLQVNEKIIVSKELESILDKENVFGVKSQADIPVTIWIEGAIIRSHIVSFFFNSARVKVEFLTTSTLAKCLLAKPIIKKITVGDEEDRIDIENCKIKSLTVSAKEDLYLCRIIISSNLNNYEHGSLK